MLGLLFLFAIILIGLAVAAPKVAKEIQRQKEIETVHRGEQYKRAIQLYYRKFGTYPTSLDQLKKTDGIRFLRQDYVDPMTGKKDWKLLHLGQVRMVAMGFFGQQMQVAGIPGVPGTGVPGAATGTPAAALGSSGIGSNINADDYFSDTPSTNSDAYTSANEAPGTTKKQSTDTADNGTPSDQSSGSSMSGGFGGGSMSGGLGGSSMSGGLGGSSMSGGLGGSSMSGGLGSSGTGSARPTGGGIFGSAQGTGIGGASGGPIVGVTVPLKTHSMLTYRKQSIYDKWQFVYNPQEEISSATGVLGAATSGAGIGTPAGASSYGTGSGFGSTGTGIGSPSTSPSSFGGGFGSSPSPGSSPSLGSSPSQPSSPGDSPF